MNKRKPLPVWLKRPLPATDSFDKTRETIHSLNLETICDSANCPNRGQCWNRGTATVLILGNICTRNCKFCSVPKGKPLPPDPTEPQRLAEMVSQMGIKYLVMTSVDRDDLEDGGASHFHDCIKAVRDACPQTRFEILVPDFRDCQEKALDILAPVMPFVLGHNVETVPSLYKIARMGGNYQLSLNLLRLAKEKLAVQTKSSIMLGLGETDSEVEQVLHDLHDNGVDRVTLGQYLRPSKTSLDVIDYVTPEKFDWWKQQAKNIGIKWVMSSPFTRSSYFAEQETA